MFWLLLGSIFVALKLTGVIAWSWFWVLFPFFVPVMAISACAFFIGVCALLAALMDKYGK
jgi:hypothetical protein